MPTTVQTIAGLSLRHVPDAELLRRFLEGDHAAFELIVWRYQRLVLGVCRRVVGNVHDAEDAFQATFVVLARRADAIRGAHLAGWLARVAYRCAVRVRSNRRPAQSVEFSNIVAPEPISPDPDLAAILDAELDRLPDKYRVPVVLCYLHGKTYQQAAAELNCPLGTLCGRLTRGKTILRTRLIRRGVTLSAGWLTAQLSGLMPQASAVDDVARFIIAAVEGSASTCISPRASAAAQGVLRMMAWKLKLPVMMTVAVVLLFGLAAASVGFAPPPSNSTAKSDEARPSTAPKGDSQKDKGIRGLVQDSNGKPISGAHVVAVGANGSGKPLETTSDAKGRFAFDHPPLGRDTRYATSIVAAKDGFAPTMGHTSPQNAELTLTLPKAAVYAGTVKDRDGRGIAGAEVQFGVVTQHGNFTSWGYAPVAGLRGPVVQKAYVVKTDSTGAFRFTTVPDGAQLILRVNAPGFAERDTSETVHKHEYVVGSDAKPANLVLEPEAIIHGRVTSKAAGVTAKIATVHINARGLGTFNRFTTPDSEGRFEFKGLAAREYSVFLSFPEGSKAAAAGVGVNPKIAEKAEVNLEIVEGIEVTGVVKVKGGGPVAGVTIAVSGDFNPVNQGVLPATTDAEGQFRLRLPPGEASVMVWSLPTGYGYSKNNREQKVIVSSGKGPHTISEPFEVVRVVEALSGQVMDAAGKPIAHVKVSALQHSNVCGNFASKPVVASWDGQFQLPYSPNGPLEEGRSVPLRIETSDGQRFESSALIVKEGVAEVRVPTLPGINGPQDVKEDEFAGIVVDEKGKPLAGVKVHVWDWVDTPENYTFTGKDGIFRIKDCGKDQQVQVRFRKDGYSPVMIIRQQVGVKGLVIAMDRATYFEGIVRGPTGRPAAGAVIRVDQGPKMMDGGLYTQVWTETTADTEGRYRLYVQPDEYAFHVKVADVGVARLPKTGIGHGQKRKFDITLQPGIVFKAKVVDSVSGKPVAGLRVFDWQQKDIDGKSDANGEVVIKNMLPGDFTFQIESSRYARWWSEQSIHQWQRKTIDDPKTGWQRNFDGLTFDLKLGTDVVTIVAEPAVRVTGRVLDPNGKPVGGATVAPARTGSGNSLTGDTRFSEVTKADGTFTMTMPASGAAEYNLVVHDGKYNEWRKWGNGVLPPIRTKPGQVIDGVTLRLSRPVIVRGKVVDSKGQPVAGREVRTHAADGLENRYYDPTTTTKADGTFELKFVRPAEQLVQVAPFWLYGTDAPVNTSRTLKLKEGETVKNITLVAEELPQK